MEPIPQIHLLWVTCSAPGCAHVVRAEFYQWPSSKPAVSLPECSSPTQVLCTVNLLSLWRNDTGQCVGSTRKCYTMLLYSLLSQDFWSGDSRPSESLLLLHSMNQRVVRSSQLLRLPLPQRYIISTSVFKIHTRINYSSILFLLPLEI